MIKINLLPFRAARAKENIRKQVSIFLLLLVFVVLSMFYATTLIDKKIKSLEDGVAHLNEQIVIYKAKADEVTAIEKELAILEQKLNAVRDLESMRKDPVILLDAMTRLVVPEQMWITYMQTSDSTVTLRGVAFDNRTVADFMTNIENSPLFKSVDLQTLQMQDVQSVKVKTFEVLSHKAPRGSKDVKKEEQNKRK
ncbi:MAG: PilN domain-containing protein [Desulfamplus sp.]|nr:PilN domain-containing protein [Desulfamplus sp.]MBF0389656.1 PilN domain-containing protein [Desulfamplus sp.]